ncbi:sigma-54-dependent transcriptional regulator [Marinibactrum halimedae]|uniref:Sigma-54-dependent Fis family transcriptional regulator n=1 Tax=Marinibactrum halimedae TaxID=1444977 RepID=A0AA37T426_9GAMM|nr:sigma-54 dependent transcriptional regulator [Marinibactrum halimedae]MCD9458490.1 sigma-54 dependent transcriptional regulator [Marinibactrum halimedae]GLS26648.1 sigma-54-dependent Fis family transcriptional regulator [Marinibactrum halimedae]
MNKPHILIVDDRHDIFLSASFVLEDNGYYPLQAKSPGEARAKIKQNHIDLILLDMNYSLDINSGEEGLAFLSWLSESSFMIPVVAMTAWANVELAVKAMQLGAGDFIEKPWKNQRLLQIIKQQLKLSNLQNQNQKLKQRLEPKKQESFTWRSDCMVQLMQQIDSVADTEVSILLTGENGTGKSQLAEKIHSLSCQKSGPFIAVNMGAITDSLFESEMFGHKRGAFTDAKSNRIGRIELAKQGTLFLDEIANIPLSQQAKLLRVLESGQYEVLGSSQTQQMKTRIISATNADLHGLIATDRFREDLYYRLNTLEFRVPALREREEDIIPLAEHFIAIYRMKYQKPTMTLGETCQRALLNYPWPGNIRELSHLMERTVLLARNTELSENDLPITPKSATAKSISVTREDTFSTMTLEQSERHLIEQALARTDNNITQAAKLLGLTKSSLYRRLEKYSDIQR